MGKKDLFSCLKHLENIMVKHDKHYLVIYFIPATPPGKFEAIKNDRENIYELFKLFNT